ncbi:MAG: Clp protease N-terminal domain-containing protein [Capsulimonadaceae bacterium]|nr:Clp protease N-terminal domain-containing protein [Capsulimonadaceae bacterium]
MWQRFTERARRTVFFAQEEAMRQGVAIVEPVHLLLGLLREDTCPACKILTNIGHSAADARERLLALAGPAVAATAQVDLTLSATSKQVIDLAYDEATKLHHGFIGTEHLLLALVRVRDASGQPVPVAGDWDLDAMRVEAAWVNEAPEKTAAVDKAPEAMRFIPKPSSNRDLTSELREIIDNVADGLDAQSAGAFSLFFSALSVKVLRKDSHPDLFDSIGVDKNELMASLREMSLTELSPREKQEEGGRFACLLDRATQIAQDLGWRQTDCDHAIIAAVEDAEHTHGDFANVLTRFGITSVRLHEAAGRSADQPTPTLMRTGVPINNLTVSLSGEASLDAAASVAIWRALVEAQNHSRRLVTDVDILKALVAIENGAARKALADAGVDIKALRETLATTDAVTPRIGVMPQVQRFNYTVSGGRPVPPLPELSKQSAVAFSRARKIAQEGGRDEVLPSDLLLALMTAGGPLLSLFFETIGLDSVLAEGLLEEIRDSALANEEAVDEGEEEI